MSFAAEQMLLLAEFIEKNLMKLNFSVTMKQNDLQGKAIIDCLFNLILKHPSANL